MKIIVSVLGVTEDRCKDINMKLKWVNHTHVKVKKDMEKDMERGLHGYTRTYTNIWTHTIHTYIHTLIVGSSLN